METTSDTLTVAARRAEARESWRAMTPSQRARCTAVAEARANDPEVRHVNKALSEFWKAGAEKRLQRQKIWDYICKQRDLSPQP